MNESGEEPKRSLSSLIYRMAAEESFTLGAEDYTQFVEAALSSKIPEQYVEAMLTQIDRAWPAVAAGLSQAEIINAYPRIAEILFEKQFATAAEAQYAVSHAHAVAQTKVWKQSNLLMTEHLNQFAKALGCEPADVAERIAAYKNSGSQLDAAVPALQRLLLIDRQIRRDAVSIYGMSKRILLDNKKLPGQKTRDYLESYFASPTSLNRMVFLARSTRK